MLCLSTTDATTNQVETVVVVWWEVNYPSHCAESPPSTEQSHSLPLSGVITGRVMRGSVQCWRNPPADWLCLTYLKCSIYPLYNRPINGLENGNDLADHFQTEEAATGFAHCLINFIIALHGQNNTCSLCRNVSGKWKVKVVETTYWVA